MAGKLVHAVQYNSYGGGSAGLKVISHASFLCSRFPLVLFFSPLSISEIIDRFLSIFFCVVCEINLL